MPRDASVMCSMFKSCDKETCGGKRCITFTYHSYSDFAFRRKHQFLSKQNFLVVYSIFRKLERVITQKGWIRKWFCVIRLDFKKRKKRRGFCDYGKELIHFHLEDKGNKKQCFSKTKRFYKPVIFGYLLGKYLNFYDIF